MPAGERRVGLILLAAGAGTRFGGSKLTAPLGGKPLWTWAARAAEESRIALRFLVVAPGSPVDAPHGWHRIENLLAERGMGTSIAAGVAAAQGFGCTRVVVTLADMPFVCARHLARLAGEQGPVFTRHSDGRSGAPAAFPQDRFAALCKLDGDRGAQALEMLDARVIEAPDPATLVDVDTREALARLQG